MKKIIYYSYYQNKISCVENVDGKDISSFDWGTTFKCLKDNFNGYKFIRLEGEC